MGQKIEFKKITLSFKNQILRPELLQKRDIGPIIDGSKWKLPRVDD